MIKYLLPPTKTLFSIQPCRESKVVFLGVPFDSNTTCRSGSRFAPWYVRLASEFLEEFSLLYQVDIRECSISDWGNIDVSHGDFRETLRRCNHVIKSITTRQRYIFLGGDHTISLITASIFRDSIDKCVILDAHADFYDEYQGNKYSHACTSKRLGELLGFENISIIGIRSMSRQSKRNLEEFGVEYYTIFDIRDDETILMEHLKKADYISIDMDFFDPSIIPSVACPEPLGYDLKSFIRTIPKIKAKIVDIAEIVPKDPFDLSAIVTATILREIGIQLSLG